MNNREAPPPPRPGPPRPPSYMSDMIVETGIGPEKLDLDEVDAILKMTLMAKHYNNPTVVIFIKSYLRCRDVKQCAKECGLTPAQARALRTSPDIYFAIAKLTEKAVIKDGLDVGEILAKVKEIMDVDIADFENEDGSYKTSLSSIPPETRRAVKKFKVKNLYGMDSNGIQTKVGELIEVELWNKMEAIQMLGREKGLFKTTSVVQHDVTSNMKDLLLGSARRAEAAAIEARAPKDVTPIDVPADEVKKNE